MWNDTKTNRRFSRQNVSFFENILERFGVQVDLPLKFPSHVASTTLWQGIVPISSRPLSCAAGVDVPRDLRLKDAFKEESFPSAPASKEPWTQKSKLGVSSPLAGSPGGGCVTGYRFQEHPWRWVHRCEWMHAHNSESTTASCVTKSKIKLSSTLYWITICIT